MPVPRLQQLPRREFMRRSSAVSVATSTPHSGGISSGRAMPARITYQHSLLSCR